MHCVNLSTPGLPLAPPIPPCPPARLSQELELKRHALRLLEERLQGSEAAQLSGAVAGTEAELAEAQGAVAAAQQRKKEMAAAAKASLSGWGREGCLVGGARVVDPSARARCRPAAVFCRLPASVCYSCTPHPAPTRRPASPPHPSRSCPTRLPTLARSGTSASRRPRTRCVCVCRVQGVQGMQGVQGAWVVRGASKGGVQSMAQRD